MDFSVSEDHMALREGVAAIMKRFDAERKEAGKGSETGQQKREEHSRKWWKFWD